MDRLDDTDEHILAELADNSRATFAEIGAGELVGAGGQASSRSDAGPRRHPGIYDSDRSQRAGLEHRSLCSRCSVRERSRPIS